MSTGINHVVLTRFNLPSQGVESLIRAKEGWLRERVELFERYCLPSLVNQTTKDFRWIVYLDPESPDWLLDRMAVHARNGVLVPVLRESVSTSELLEDIRGVVAREEPVLITTNVDNDDGVAKDFLERIQAVPHQDGRVAVYVTEGLVRSSTRLYRLTYARNAFNSVRESWSEPVTSWSEWHTELGEKMPVIEIGRDPGWLQVIHGANVSNRVKGRLVSPAPYRDRFGSLLDDVPEPTLAALLADTLVRRPVRASRDALRTVVKTLVMRLSGREGLDQVKQLAARLRRSR
jgi:N-acetylglucosaminyl-diphospho-decaprenol L-rhamnosyltransferase